MKRLNKEYSLDLNKYIDVKYGSINRECPLVVYLECKTWLTPHGNIECVDNIHNIMCEFKKKLRSAILNDNVFKNNFVFDFDVKTASLRENKKSFMSFEVYFKQNADFLMLKELSSHITANYASILNYLVEELNENTFTLSKTKR